MSMNKHTPAVSVVMPVHNALPFLDESVKSILNQTFRNFEFVILDDASTDGSTERLREWAGKDARIRLYEAREKIGPSGISNFIVKRASAPFIARMDADDISHVERLGRQLEVLKRHPDVALVGTLFDGIDVKGRRVRQRDRWRLMRKTAFPPFPHGSVMFRRQIYEDIGGYRDECDAWEDQDFFLRIRMRARVVVLTDPLYSYRFHAESITSNRTMERVTRSFCVRQRCLDELRRGRDYTRMLADRTMNGDRGEALAYALYLRGSMRLWAGYKPETFKLLLEYKPLGLGHYHLKTLVWATWGALSPGSLRFFLSSFMRTRDFLAGYRVKDGGIHEWRLE
ncbi:MAG: glycosyltransferase family 2 protein [Acidobacteria bacterium]|nr:glycosyltransferase family 2 protein [Acidobacteriota bacterium]